MVVRKAFSLILLHVTLGTEGMRLRKVWDKGRTDWLITIPAWRIFFVHVELSRSSHV